MNILDITRKNVAISSLRIDRKTAQPLGEIAFSITFKEIPIVNNESILCDTAKIQRANTTQLGKANGKTLTNAEKSTAKGSILYNTIFG